ncbi:hypothetical protein T265_07648 [Opisthorchis viverrini]|uniref:Uncharacterized protein n=1 Tax=Opisthorchis viverrini TaxID=6198 RepID=A0A074ZGI4_OPIVI|nr:hypothetical protein T265_07648 [Opisthorchis viverrini]KER24762.1 hypothetical protein T265_07648 [Opisthorchis viverrini]
MKSIQTALADQLVASSKEALTRLNGTVFNSLSNTSQAKDNKSDTSFQDGIFEPTEQFGFLKPNRCGTVKLVPSLPPNEYEMTSSPPERQQYLAATNNMCSSIPNPRNGIFPACSVAPSPELFFNLLLTRNSNQLSFIAM